MTQKEVKEHFEKIASRYDWYKQRQWLYFWCLKKTAARWAVGRVLDYGCGTGGVMLSLNPKEGVGFDISGEMIKKANSKKAEARVTFTNDWRQVRGQFDTVLCMDVVEHMAKPEDDFARMAGKLKAGGRLVVTLVGPEWEWLLSILERQGWKMPEGEYRRVSGDQVKTWAGQMGCRLESESLALPVFLIKVLVFKKVRG